MILKIILGLLFVTAISITAISYHFGAFAKTVIAEQEIGPWHIAYRNLDGINTKDVQEIKASLGKELSDQDITPTASFDMYYPKGSGTLNKIGFELTPADFTTVSTLSGFTVETIPEGRYMTTTFPFNGALSFIFMYMKVDPAFRAYRQENGYSEAPAATRFEFEKDNIFCLQPIIR